MTRRSLPALALVATTALAGCLGAWLGAESEPAPDFTLATVDGRNVTLASYAGRVLVLDFMATTCAPCEGMREDLERLIAAEGVVVLSVSILTDAEERTALARWANESPNGTWDYALDDAGVFATYGGRVIPYLVFVDEDGVIRARESGDVAYPRMQSLARIAREAA